MFLFLIYFILIVLAAPIWLAGFILYGLYCLLRELFRKED